MSYAAEYCSCERQMSAVQSVILQYCRVMVHSMTLAPPVSYISNFIPAHLQEKKMALLLFFNVTFELLSLSSSLAVINGMLL